MPVPFPCRFGTVPVPPPRLHSWTLALPPSLVAHLDDQARQRHCSRAAYLRLLIQQDLDRLAQQA